MTDRPAIARRLIAGNWKMNGRRADGSALAMEIARRARQVGGAALGCEIVICPPATLLTTIGLAIAESPLELGAQDCHGEVSGAHTGGISAVMLADLCCRYVIVGHSERRTDHGETDGMVRAKAAAAHGAGMVAIVCVGETEAQRQAGETLRVVERQFRGSLPPGAGPGNTVIAYEPVWAIGSGRVPSQAEVAEVHGHLRQLGEKLLGNDQRLRLLYGGSVKAGNAVELMAIENVDGALVGGASLKADEFWAIVESCGHGS
ncbi:MAG: triose-phosphate isomerase [Dongiaceae bacterium]